MSSWLFSYRRAFEVYDWRGFLVDFGISAAVGLAAVALTDGLAEDPGEVSSKFLDMGLRALPVFLAAEVTAYCLTLLLMGQMSSHCKGWKWPTTVEMVNSDFAVCALLILFSLFVFVMDSFLHSLSPYVNIGVPALLLSLCLMMVYDLVDDMFMLGQVLAHSGLPLQPPS